jgi:chromosome segregation protein
LHLKSLTLKGFKSFADRAHLVLEPGVTVIVGPNGSGKSNISDAVLWVLGEQSAKSLRGQAMEDVIFAGSSARQPVGVAEVDLVLDNADGSLPLEFSEVTIARRMYRNGESEYMINSTPCRLMDVYELLHDSGLGRDTHSIISQGRLDEVLNSRPEDRRALIEEAAGVLKHKKRKERALRKLAGMEGHLDRARDVLSEIDRQLRPLERQATKAAQHAQVATELRDLEVALAVDDLRTLQSRWDELAKREREQDAELELARYRLAEKEKELGRFQQLLEEKGLFVGDLGEQRRRLQAVLERINSGLLLLEEKGKNLIERLSQLRATIHQAESRLAVRQRELGQLTEERANTDAQLKGHYSRLGELRRESETVKKERLAAERELTRVNTDIRRARKEIDDSRLELAKVEQALAAVVLEEEFLAERGEQLKTQRASAMATLSGRRQKYAQLEAGIRRTRKEISLADSDVDKRVRVLGTRKRELAEARDTLTGVRAEIRGLEEVDRAFETATPALAWVLSQEKKLPGLVGPVTDLISVDPELERLVEQALGADLFCLLVEDGPSAEKLLKMLRKNDAGDISVLALSAARPVKVQVPKGARSLMDTLVCEDRIRDAVAALVGDVCVVNTLARAVEASAASPGLRFGVADGTIVHPSGKVAVGPTTDTSAGVLARKRRVNELAEDASAVEMRVGDAEALVSEAEEALSAAQQDALELGQRLAVQNGEATSLKDEIGRMELALTEFDAEAARLAERAGAIVEKTAKDRPAAAELKDRIADTTARLDALEEEAAQRREDRDARFRDEAAISNRLGQCQVDVATVSEREVFLKRQLSTVNADMAELESTFASSRQTEEALETLRERIQPIHDLYSALLERAEHWAEKLRDRARFEQADSESLRGTIHGAQDAVRAAQGELDGLASGMTETQVAKGQLEVQVTSAVERIVEGLETPLERAQAQPPVEDRDAAMELAHRLRKQIANMGPVNPVAVSEYDALKDRREFLARQIDDLASSRAALSKVVRAIDRKMRDRFSETFAEVDRHFQAVFAVLFPGGQAELRLTDPDNLEESGVEVVAQPRGKKLAKMSLMSGGEKSLVALALLFALYHTRPCPFYILDEVEAALDDSNLRRFITLTNSLRERTQFLIVSHQRRTMETADVLYGVSMQADGVSKVVSQKLERRDAPEEEPADDRAVV